MMMNLPWWMTTMKARLAGALVLWLVVELAKHAPKLGPWLDCDSGWLLTSGRKKLTLNVLLALSTVPVMLLDESIPLDAVLSTAATLAVGAAGLDGLVRGVRR